MRRRVEKKQDMEAGKRSCNTQVWSEFRYGLTISNSSMLTQTDPTSNTSSPFSNATAKLSFQSPSHTFLKSFIYFHFHFQSSSQPITFLNCPIFLFIIPFWFLCFLFYFTYAFYILYLIPLTWTTSVFLLVFRFLF